VIENGHDGPGKTTAAPSSACRIARLTGYDGGMGMGNLIYLVILVWGVVLALALITVVWLGAMIYRRRFGLREVFVFVAWAAVCCAILGWLWRISN
jgi:hypothetical protein